MVRLRTAVLIAAAGLAGCDATAVDDAPTFGDGYAVLVTAGSPDVVNGRLSVAVEYAGGCEDHEFVLRSRADGDGAEVWFVHDAKGDTCRQLQTATVREALPGAVLDAERASLLTPSGDRIALPAGR